MRFSIVIPAMNRQETLDYTIKTIQACNFEDSEIIVHDGASETPLVVPDGVKLFRAEDNRSMCTDWNSALSYANGDYIILIGCDDGILPHALHDIDNILDDMNTPPLIRWNRCYYTWKDEFFAQRSGELQITIGGSSFMMDSHKLISAASMVELDYTFLPMLYTSAIRRDLLDELIAKTGKVVDDISPDIYSGFAFASLVDKVPSINKAMTINAGSRWSTGVNNLSIGNTKICEDFHFNNIRDNLLYDDRIPLNKTQTLWGSIKNSFYKACENGLIDEATLDGNPGRIAFDGQVIYEKADDVFEASVIAGEILRNEKYDLSFKNW